MWCQNPIAISIARWIPFNSFQVQEHVLWRFQISFKHVREFSDGGAIKHSMVARPAHERSATGNHFPIIIERRNLSRDGDDDDDGDGDGKGCNKLYLFHTTYGTNHYLWHHDQRGRICSTDTACTTIHK